MNYNQSIEYIKNIEKAGTDLGIERMRELLELLGNPDKFLKFIHIAGTNGKGSVSCYLTSILKESGLKIGTYNSPSVFQYNERFLNNGQQIENDDIAKFMTIIKNTIENEQKIRNAFNLPKFSPTAFEIETALFFLCCYEKECDLCVLETGLGGRWDATNVIKDKELAIITRIGIDHCNYLGNSLQQIASEKSAIIKDKAITIKQDEKIMHEIFNPYKIKDGKKEFRKVDIKIASEPRILKNDASGQVFVYDDEEYEIKMLGKHQVENASLAICAIQNLDKNKYKISSKAIKNGLFKAKWNARFDIINNKQFDINIPKNKVLIFDGAHNLQGAKVLSESLNFYFKEKKIHLVFGVFKDKDVDGIIKILSTYANEVTAVKSKNDRACNLEIIVEKFDKYNIKANSNMDIKQAINDALDGDCEVVVVCGSLSLFENLK